MRGVIEATVGRLFGFIGGVLFVAAALVFNGGLIYRTTCPLPGGGEETHWTYALDDLIPYIRSTEAPCRANTATRVALDSVGIFEIPERGVASASRADMASATALAKTTRAIASEWARQRREVTRLQPMTSDGTTAAELEEMRGLIRTSSKNLLAIKATVERTPPSDDEALQEVKSLLSRWLGMQVAVNTAHLDSNSSEELAKRRERLGRSLVSIVEALRPVAAEVEAKYQVRWNWSYLPTS